MDIVHVLVAGYARPVGDDLFVASPTTTLIQTEGRRIIVDPGANSDAVLTALTHSGLKPDDIDLIYLSHYHPDHFLNIRLFPNVDICDGTTRWSRDEEYSYSSTVPGTNIRIIATPGHSPEHTSLLVHTASGIVCIAQDVFWWEDGKQQSDTKEQLMEAEDMYATDVTALRASRMLVLENADWIIPGHGKMFRNPLRPAK